MTAATDGIGAAAAPSFSVVVPAHQAAALVGRCLAALVEAGFPPEEILVVDDGSTDGTGEAAAAHGVRVMRHDGALGPARARNAGAAAVQSEILVFVDADVVIHPGARDRLGRHFRDQPELVAVFGSYDDSPESPRPVSLYRNLLHHHVHQTGQPEAETFWTGFGAVRRGAFEAQGGFDPAWQDIEDVEFGLRLRAAGGRIRLDRGLLCRHLKDWTLRSMFRTDWKGRALPWSRLLLEGRAMAGDLNLSRRHRLSGALTALLPVGLLAGVAAPALLWSVPAILAAFVALNAGFLRLLARRRGPALALRSVGYHLAHYAAADLGYLEARIGRMLSGAWRGAPPAPGAT